MVERAPEFSDYEKDEIAKQARDIAKLGQFGSDAIFDIVSARTGLMKLIILWPQCAEAQEVFTSQEQIQHEVDILSSVIDQARVLMQIEGTDEMSILDRRTVEGGLGSVFDPESEISKSLKGKGLDLFND